MAKEVKLFKSKERKNREDVVAFLHNLADKVASGKVVLSQGDEELTLTPSENVTLEVEVEKEEKRRKGTEHSLEIEISWYDNDKRPAKGLVLK